MKIISSLDKAKNIAQLASEKKGENIVLMDMRSVSMMCDWFVLVTASSSRRVTTIASTIRKTLSKEKISPLNVAGRQDPLWALLDYGDVVAHVFYREVRDFYGLERLWSNAKIRRLDDKCSEKTLQKE